MKLIEHSDHLCLQPDQPATRTLICLHGLGADGYDWLPILQSWRTSQPTQCLCLHAPYRNVTINQGLSMRAWYDIFDRNLTMKEDTQGLHQATQRVQTTIQTIQQTTTDDHQIILVGFSMGGALALYTALTTPGIHGVAGLACYLPLATQWPYEPLPSLPIFLAHGQHDDIIPLAWSHQSYQLLLKTPNTQLHTYPIGHYIGKALIDDLLHWLDNCSAHAAEEIA